VADYKCLRGRRIGLKPKDPLKGALHQEAIRAPH